MIWLELTDRQQRGCGDNRSGSEGVGGGGLVRRYLGEQSGLSFLSLAKEESRQ